MKKEAEHQVQSLATPSGETKKESKKLKKEFLKANAEGTYGTAAEPRKSLSTFLRNKNKADISLVSILDRKAAILIRITTTLVSAFIVFHNYIDENVLFGGIMSDILIGGMLITLVLSLLAAKPFTWIFSQVFRKEILPKHPNLEDNIYFAVEPCSLEEYEEAMRKVVQSQDLQLGNQIRANYMITKNNGAKAMMLDLAYIVFLLTFVIIGIIFVYGKF